MAKRHPHTDRSHGGPGSSQQDATDPHEAKRSPDAPEPGEPTNPNFSRVSGGGGERDRHHSHDDRQRS